MEKLPLQGWTARRRKDLLQLLGELNRQIDELDQAVAGAAEEHPQARLLMTQPGVGPITALAFVLTIGDVSRFRHSKQVASYLGLVPREHSSGGKQRLGAISKQGNRFLRQLLVEAAQTANRLDEGFRRQYQARCHHKPKGVAKVAAARKLAVRLYWMLRQNVGYPEIARIESSPRVPLTGRCQVVTLNERLASSNRLDVRMEASWPAVGGRIDGWWGVSAHRLVMQRESTRALVLNPSGKTSDAHAAHS